MSTTSENRDIEVLFKEVMPGYRCLVSRQAEGAINLQFENLSSPASFFRRAAGKLAITRRQFSRTKS